MLILPIHEHGRSLNFLRSSPIYCPRDLKFLSYRSFTCFIKFTPRYFILFVTIVKAIFSLISFSVCLSFEQRKATYLFELILYPARLLKFFISFSSLVEFLGSLKYTIMSYANTDIFTSSFPSCLPLISFCCLITPARTSSTMLNRQRESGQPFLIPDFSRIASNFSLLSLILGIGLLCIVAKHILLNFSLTDIFQRNCGKK